MLEALIKHFEGGNKAQFAKRLGVTPQAISTWLSRSTFDKELIFAKCEFISPEWLLTGEGSMLREEGNVHKEVVEYPAVNQNFRGAPYFNVDFIGGFDWVENDQTHKPDFYINYPPYNKEGVVWVNLTGHSMEPEISNGDIIALRLMETPIEHLPSGEIYAIITEDYRTVKRIRLSERPGFVWLIPSNKSEEFQKQEIPISIIRKVYAVLGSIRKFF